MLNTVLFGSSTTNCAAWLLWPAANTTCGGDGRGGVSGAQGWECCSSSCAGDGSGRQRGASREGEARTAAFGWERGATTAATSASKGNEGRGMCEERWPRRRERGATIGLARAMTVEGCQGGPTTPSNAGLPASSPRHLEEVFPVTSSSRLHKCHWCGKGGSSRTNHRARFGLPAPMWYGPNFNPCWFLVEYWRGP